MFFKNMKIVLSLNCDFLKLIEYMNNKDFLSKMPKVELHVHVEGAVSADVYYHLAQKNKVELLVNSLEEWRQLFEFRDFSHFIDVYIMAVSTLKMVEDYTFLIEEFYRYQSSQNIVYSEAFLSATFLVENFSNLDIINAIEKGIKAGEEKYHVKVKFIPDIARNIPNSKNAVLDLVLEGCKRDIFIGLGLGGLENGFPAKMFSDVYQKAKENGLRVVAHAGEAVGAESIWSAINDLKAERIGHGIRCVDDEILMEYLKNHQIPMEVCPSSNYCLKVTNANEIHPIRKMLDAGLLCTLNSDDPVMFSTSLTDEYLLLLKQGFSMEELWTLNLNSIKSSFITKDHKIQIIKQFNEFRNEYLNV